MSTENDSLISEWKELIKKEVKNETTFNDLFERKINEIEVQPIFINSSENVVFTNKTTDLSVYFSDQYISSKTIIELINFSQNFGAKNIYIETENPTTYAELGNKISIVSKTKDDFIFHVNENILIDLSHLYTENVHDELAFLLRKIKQNATAKKIIIRLPINSNFFFQLAKFRTLRMILNDLFEKNIHFEIHAVTSFYNKTLHDSYNNVLRNTTEALSAIVGGADELQVLPHDILLKEISVSSLGLAMNVQHILAEESLVQNIPDIASKAFYIETICGEIKTKTLELYNGKQTDEELLQKIKAFKSDKPVIGVTKQPNKNEDLSKILDKKYFEKVIGYYEKHRTYNEEMERIG